MIKLLIAVCVCAYVVAQHHGDNGNHNHHHPHPGGDIHCQQTSDCPSCNSTLTAVCENHQCMCSSQIAKRENCHRDHDCKGVCPDGQNEVCNSQGHCDCGDHIVGKRAGETCSTDSDCPSCTHGTPTCEKHNDNDGHCHCKH